MFPTPSQTCRSQILLLPQVLHSMAESDKENRSLSKTATSKGYTAKVFHDPEHNSRNSWLMFRLLALACLCLSCLTFWADANAHSEGGRVRKGWPCLLQEFPLALMPLSSPSLTCILGKFLSKVAKRCALRDDFDSGDILSTSIVLIACLSYACFQVFPSFSCCTPSD